MSSWRESRQEAVRNGTFETKVFAPSMETKPGIPHRAEKIRQTVDRAISEARNPSGTPVSQERKRELQQRIDSVIQRIRALGRANTRKVREHRSEATTASESGQQKESRSPAWPVYFSAQRMRLVCRDLLEDLPVPTPMVRWSTRASLEQKAGRGTLGHVSGTSFRKFISVANDLDLRTTLKVVAHEYKHAEQMHRDPSYRWEGLCNASKDSQMEQEATRFHRKALREYERRHGPISA